MMFPVLSHLLTFTCFFTPGLANLRAVDCRPDDVSSTSSLLQIQSHEQSIQSRKTLVKNELKSQTPKLDHFWSQKNSNARRSASATFVATTALTKPKWANQETGGNPLKPASNTIYQSPVIDRDNRIYFSSNSGKIRCLHLLDGSECWSFQLGGPPGSQVPTPVLMGDSLFTADSEGNLVALSLSTGTMLWHSHYSDSDAGFDSWSLAGLGNVVLLLGTASGTNATLYAASVTDGHILWKFECKSVVYNFMPALTDDFVLFADSFGAVFCLDLSDGDLIWQLPGQSGIAMSTGGLAIGFNNIVYVTSNVAGASCTPSVDLTSCGDGVLSAIDIETGKLLWNRTFSGHPANNAPAVFMSQVSKNFNVVIGLGANPLLPCDECPALVDEKPQRPSPDLVVALDASTGADVWSFQTPIWKSNAPAGSTLTKVCWPDAFSNPAVDSNGTVFIGWKGGILFALDGFSGSKLSELDVGSAFGGSPALAPGAVVVASCNELLVFTGR
jgi:outer membrane protein assembly factor BamB